MIIIIIIILHNKHLMCISLTTDSNAPLLLLFGSKVQEESWSSGSVV